MIEILTDALIRLASSEDVPIYQSYERKKYLSEKTRIFGVISLREASFSDDGISCRIRLELRLLGDNSVTGAELSSLCEALTEKILASSLPVKSVIQNQAEFSAKLNRLEVSSEIILLADMRESPPTEKKSLLSLTDGVSISVDSYTASRERALSAVQSVCGGSYLSDGGSRLLSLCISGKAGSTADFEFFENALCEGIGFNFDFEGMSFTSMQLKSYSLKSDRDSLFTEINAEFISRPEEEAQE